MDTVIIKIQLPSEHTLLLSLCFITVGYNNTFQILRVLIIIALPQLLLQRDSCLEFYLT